MLDPGGDLPDTLAGVREERPRDAAVLVVNTPESDSRIASFDLHPTSAGGEPEAEPVASVRARCTSFFEHLRERRLTDDRARKERPPERRHVCGGRVDAAVAGAANRQVEDVRPPRPIDLHVSDRRAPGKVVRAEKGSAVHPRGPADE